MPPVLKELILQPRGLFLMVGATGVGKTTTLASLIDYRNANRTGHILTLEDPIEFVFRNQQSIVNPCQERLDYFIKDKIQKKKTKKQATLFDLSAVKTS